MGGATEDPSNGSTHTCGDISKRECDPSPKQIATPQPITKQHTEKHTYKYLGGGRPRHRAGCGLVGSGSGRVSLWLLATTVETRSCAGIPIPTTDTARQHDPRG